MAPGISKGQALRGSFSILVDIAVDSNFRSKKIGSQPPKLPSATLSNLCFKALTFPTWAESVLIASLWGSTQSNQQLSTESWSKSLAGSATSEPHRGDQFHLVSLELSVEKEQIESSCLDFCIFSHQNSSCTSSFRPFSHQMFSLLQYCAWMFAFQTSPLILKIRGKGHIQHLLKPWSWRNCLAKGWDPYLHSTQGCLQCRAKESPTHIWFTCLPYTTRWVIRASGRYV